MSGSGVRLCLLLCFVSLAAGKFGQVQQSCVIVATALLNLALDTLSLFEDFLPANRGRVNALVVRYLSCISDSFPPFSFLRQDMFSMI